MAKSIIFSLSCAALLTVSTLTYGQGPQEKRKFDFDIHLKNADQSLIEFAEQANLIFILPFDALRGIKVRRVRGQYTVNEALSIMLKNTGLQAHVDDQGQLIIINDQNDETINMIQKNKLSAAVIAALTSTTLLSANASANDQANQENLEVIQVRGIQSSLTKAMGIKQDAAGIQDSIVAEDIGKFPDQNVAESLQRITGVTISRENGEGSKITVRGFGPKFNVVKVNDRTLATTDGGRDFDFQVLASELISGADVVKTPTADLTAGSIGAYVNITTARPFDSVGFHALGSVNAKYNDLSEEFDPQYSGVISNTFNDDSFGVLFGFSVKETNSRIDKYRTNRWHELYAFPENLTGDVRNENGDVVDVAGFRRPGRAAFDAHEEKRERTGANLVLQWAPNDDIVSTFDVLYTDLNREVMSLGYQIPTQATQYSNAVVNENDTLLSATISDNNIDLLTRQLGQESTTWAYGFNTEYNKDNLTVEFDASYSNSESTPILREYVPHFTLPDNLAGREIDIDYGAGDVLNTSATIDITDIDNIRAHWNGASHNEIEDEVTELKLDATYQFDGDFLESIQVGTAYLDRTNTNNAFNIGGGGGYCSPCGGELNAIYPNANEIFELSSFSNFLGDESGVFPRNWVIIKDINAYVDATQALAEKNWYVDGNGVWQTDDGTLGSPLVAPGQMWNTETQDLAASYENQETTFSFYARANLVGEVGNISWSGNAGLRYINIDNTSLGFSQSITNISINPSSNASELRLDVNRTEALPVSEDSSNSYLLPSINVNFDLNDGLFLRSAIAQTISRPAIADTGVNQSIAVDNTGQVTRLAGNPQLKPYKVNQFDLSLEYYQENGNAYSVAYFYKDITDFISTFSSQQDFIGNVDADVLARISGNALPETSTSKENRSGGSVSGLELSVLHYFDYLPSFLSGFGVQANYTYADSSDDGASLVNQPGITEPGNALEGFAKNSYNLIAFYDEGGIQARLAYNWRNNFLHARDGAANSIAASLPVHTDAYGQLDASVSYDINERITISAEAINLTNESRLEYVDIRERVSIVEYSGVRYQMGIRAKF
ncbi:TonB-dependent receptor [Paraglaciecola sp. L3A3]|uniref:TonB-dependent receptor n=1 Tax=Paraglaciecola sp. L3A3 TaxID=2686358 RepID=UPI00131E0D5F|nr:TonB-dependent receptor [Paraglaciecola sp. L3A3]